VRVDEHTIQLAGEPVFYRRANADGAGGSDGGATVLYLHGVPTSSDDWLPFLERTGGVAPDLIGFGRSAKGGHLEYSLDSLTNFVDNFVDNLGIGRIKLVLHDWGGAVGLRFAMRHSERIERLVLFNSVPLVPGFRWHRYARLWRRPIVGELFMGAVTKKFFARSLREGTVNPEAFPDERIEAIWHQFDQGTQRAILRLYRSADEEKLAAAGAELSRLGQPALVIWGSLDPWLGPDLGQACAARLAGAALNSVEAGHWPWLDQSDIIDRVAEFLSA
jgi:pimeloyl-ACP methyl ester carboxylesterase